MPNANFVSRPNCPLCGSGNKKVIFAKAYTDPAVANFLDRQFGGKLSHDLLTDATYEIAKCPHCRILWQTQILNDRLTSYLYDDWISAATSLAKKQHGKSKLFRDYAHEMEVLTYLFPEKRPDEVSVLDYGMGWGYWLIMARAFNFNATGFELSNQRISYARSHGVNVADSNSHLAQQQFDFINMESVLEHLPNPLFWLKQMVKSLKPGGIIRIACPDGRYMERQLNNPHWTASDDSLCPLMHIVSFNRDSLLLMARLVGLSFFYHPAFFRYRKIFYKHHFATAIYVRKN